MKVAMIDVISSHSHEKANNIINTLLEEHDVVLEIIDPRKMVLVDVLAHFSPRLNRSAQNLSEILDAAFLRTEPTFTQYVLALYGKPAEIYADLKELDISPLKTAV